MKSYRILLICLKVNLSIEEGEKLGNKHVQGYGELFLTRGKDALAALAPYLKGDHHDIRSRQHRDLN